MAKKLRAINEYFVTLGEFHFPVRSIPCHEKHFLSHYIVMDNSGIALEIS